MKLQPLLAPRTVAVIGASADPQSLGQAVVFNLLQAGFAGELLLVNPTETEVLGRPCLPELRLHRRPVDLALVAVPMEQLEAAVEQTLKAQVEVLVVLTSIERRVGSQVEEVERDILRMCKARGSRLLGPNSLGVVNLPLGLNGSWVRQLPPAGGVSLLSQSSALCAAILDWAASLDLGLAKVVALGNKIDVDEMDVLQAFAEDPETRVVLGYLESIRSGKEFVRVAEQLAASKPVVLLKTATTRAGERAAAAHEGGRHAEEIAYGAAFKRSGVIRADSFQALLDDARAFSLQPLPLGSQVAVVTNAGGPGIMAADAVERGGMHMADLGQACRERLATLLPSSAGLENPVDVLGDASPERYAAAVDAVLRDGAVDAVLLVLTAQARTQPLQTAEAVIETVRGWSKPVLAAFLGGGGVAEARARLLAAGIPEYPSAERAAEALGAMCEYATWRRRPPRIVTRFPVNRRRVERILRRIQRLGLGQVEEFLGKEILRAYDFVIPAGQLTISSEEAVAAAERLGYPVVLKVVSPDLPHKRAVGGVRLNLTLPDQVRDAYDLMMLRVQRDRPDARVEGIYVEKMCPPGIEVVIGMTRDPRFGPMLMFGVGGIFVEVMEDVAFHLAPITADEAMQMLLSTRSYQILEGRGELDVDLQTIATALQRVSQLATDFAQIQELEISPFIVGRPGTGAMAADVRMTLASEGLA